MKTYQKLYREYLESYVREGRTWEKVYGDRSNATPAEIDAYKTLVKANEGRVRELVAHPETTVHTYHITGCLRGDSPNKVDGRYLDHYAIDMDLKEKFGDLYTDDSEQGQFIGYAHHTIGREVFHYLAAKYPTLSMTGQALRETLEHHPIDFSVYRVFVPGAGSWTEARKTLQEMN